MRPKIALFLAYSSICARAQMQQGLGANGQQQALQPLDSVLMQAFDKSHDGKVTLTEVLESLDGFAAMGAMGGDPGAGPNDMQKMISSAKSAAPTIFEIVDADASGGLSQKELKLFAKAEKAFKSGTLRNLTRAMFETADGDKDGSVSAAEISAAVAPDGELLDKLVALVHADFPVRGNVADMRQLVLKVMGELRSTEMSLSDGIKWLDVDGNGSIERTELGKAYKAGKEAFLKAVETLQQMGPLLAMFAGMGDMGGGGGVGGMGGRGARGGREGAGGRGRGSDGYGRPRRNPPTA